MASVFYAVPSVSGSSSDLEQIKYVINDLLSHSCGEDALTLSELLHETVRTDESLLILCDCLLRLQRIDEVYHILQPTAKTNPKLRYLFAKCCYDLEKYDECQRVLVDSEQQLHSTFRDSSSAPYARRLLASIFCETGRHSLALRESSFAVDGNPFLHSSVCKFIQLGGRDLNGKLTDIEKIMDECSLNDGSKLIGAQTRSSNCEKSRKTPVSGIIPSAKLGAPRKLRSNSEREQSTEMRRSVRLFNQDLENAGRIISKAVPSKLSRNQNQRPLPPRLQFTPGMKADLTSTSPSSRKCRDTKQPLSSRNANAMRSLSSSSNSIASTASNSTTVADAEKVPPTDEKRIQRFQSVFREVFQLVKTFACIEEDVCSYKWKDAQSLLGKLPQTMSKHALVLHMRARILFELSEYASAKEMLLEMQRLHPHRVEGMELLSTVLWQLQDSHSLSLLAQKMTRTAKKRPQTWCVAGNLFSLTRQHPHAVECLERAVQLDRHFPYAYTLLGHELVLLEKTDKAAKAFRTALCIAPNEYRAYYGLGQVYQKNEQLTLAKENIENAVRLNPYNVGMICALAQIEKGMNNGERAMSLLDMALRLKPNDVACKYNRARLLFDLKKNEECLRELEELKGLSPEEAHVFHLLGKVYRRMGSMHLSLLNFSWSTEMDPRGEQAMANGLDNSYDDNDDYSHEQE